MSFLVTKRPMIRRFELGLPFALVELILGIDVEYMGATAPSGS